MNVRRQMNESQRAMAAARLANMPVGRPSENTSTDVISQQQSVQEGRGFRPRACAPGRTHGIRRVHCAGDASKQQHRPGAKSIPSFDGREPLSQQQQHKSRGRPPGRTTMLNPTLLFAVGPFSGVLLTLIIIAASRIIGV
jgi:hypothetical protein